MNRLPTTGTAALLDVLSPYFRGELINSLVLTGQRPGRPSHFSPAQLFRVTLLALLTPAHSFNLVVRGSSCSRAWVSSLPLRMESMLV